METDRVATLPCYTLADRQIAQDVLIVANEERVVS